MEYVISNADRKLFIKIGSNGKPETCAKSDAQKFPYEKACNIVASIPKTMRKFNFSVFECEQTENIYIDDGERVFLSNPEFKLAPQVERWINRVKTCDDLTRDAKKRREELYQELSNVDKELSNILHTIEIDNWKNGCDGFKLYKASKEVLERRRPIKDELIVIRAILDSNLADISEQRMIQITNGLKNRKFEYREIEE